MTRKSFGIVSVLAIVLVVIFVSNQITQAQRPDRSEMRERERGGGRGGPGGMRGFSPTSIIDSSWTDLTFVVKVDDETLLKARPVFQKHREKLEKAVKEARDSGDFQSMRAEMAQLREAFATERDAVLTEEQISQLEKLEADRIEQMMRRGGGPGRRGGGSPRG
jgi:Spy/CpxP family protein refolding chaperone